MDASDNALARARWYPWRNQWRWVTDQVSVDGYTIRELADALKLNFGVFTSASDETGRIRDPELIELVEQVGNKLSGGWPFWAKAVFWNFTSSHWRTILSDWDHVSAEMRNGRIPQGFPYDWQWAERYLPFARERGITTVRAQSIFRGQDNDVESIYNGNFSNDDLLKLLEFTTKVRVLKFNGQIREWAISESVATTIFGGNPRFTFWYDKLGLHQVIDSCYRWVHDIDPSAKLMYIEDHVIEAETANFQRIRAGFFDLLNHFRSANVPVSKVGIENYLWIYAPPPTQETIVSDFRRIQALGFEVESAETAVIVHNTDPFWTNRRKSFTFDNIYERQAIAYRDVLEACLTVGADFTISSLSDKYSWFNDVGHPEVKAMIFDDNNQPKPAYFAIRDSLQRRVFG